MDKELFVSKILLFGEYSIIKDSMALCVPYSLFEGFLTFRKGNGPKVEPELKAFSQYLKKLHREKAYPISDFQFDLQSFDFDISQGLFFDSTIPQGFGLGSSGALCASLFSRYALNSSNKDEFLKDPKMIYRLRNYFSLMESFFHGSSSGLDPLISYLNQPILIRAKNDFERVDLSLNQFGEGEGGIFLLNTGRSRKTEPLVNLFLEKCLTSEFNKVCEEELLPVTNECIRHFRKNDPLNLLSSFKSLSLFQKEYFGPMIPPLFKELWEKGLSSNDFYLKLCGAGGGGFLLGITDDFAKVDNVLSNHEIRIVCRF
ncbi:MAG: mevalonate kinase [Halobacteriovoraceae bacterium]|nr:mevalonate kinase [Halobacteriovoraceae bacterium]